MAAALSLLLLSCGAGTTPVGSTGPAQREARTEGDGIVAGTSAHCGRPPDTVTYDVPGYVTIAAGDLAGN